MTFKQVSELSWISDNGQWIIKKHQSGSHDLYSLWNWHQLVDYFFTREDAEQAANDIAQGREHSERPAGATGSAAVDSEKGT